MHVVKEGVVCLGSVEPYLAESLAIKEAMLIFFCFEINFWFLSIHHIPRSSNFTHYILIRLMKDLPIYLKMFHAALSKVVD